MGAQTWYGDSIRMTGYCQAHSAANDIASAAAWTSTFTIAVATVLGRAATDARSSGTQAWPGNGADRGAIVGHGRGAAPGDCLARNKAASDTCGPNVPTLLDAMTRLISRRTRWTRTLKDNVSCGCSYLNWLKTSF